MIRILTIKDCHLINARSLEEERNIIINVSQLRTKTKNKGKKVRIKSFLIYDSINKISEDNYKMHEIRLDEIVNIEIENRITYLKDEMETERMLKVR